MNTFKPSSPTKELVTSAPTLLSKLSDGELYEQAKFYGQNALEWRQKFIGLLPEVDKRKLYERKGFSSILEFAKKLAGLSEDQVNRALRLDEKFEDKPILHSLLQSGTVSMNKLARVVKVATSENEDFWAEQVQNLSQKTLETLVRDERLEQRETKPKNIPMFDSVRAHNLKISEKVQEKLLELQEKGIDLDSLLLEFLEKREQEIEEEKEEIASELKETDSRYIAVKTRKVLKKEHGTKCSHPNCKKPATELHYTQRFSISHTHDPRYLAPLCKEHHQLAHLLDMKYREARKAATKQKNA